MNLSVELFTGVVTGLIIAGLSWLFSKVAIPWLQSTLYQGPTIAGNWLPYESPTDNLPFGTAQIVQKGTRVWMTLTRTRSRKGNPINRIFKYEGRFLEGQLTLLFEEEAAPGFITGAIVLRLSSDAKQFLGKTTYFDHGENTVVSYDLVLKRSS